MPIGRVPGPFGKEGEFGCVLRPHALGKLVGSSTDGEYIPSTPGPMGTNGDAGSAAARSQPAVLEEDKNELRILQDVYGVMSSSGESYKCSDPMTKRLVDNVDAYLRDRDSYFGSRAEYLVYRNKAILELDAEKEKLRKLIEPPAALRKKKADWKSAQDVFYSWVRKAYEKKLGDSAYIPKLIGAGMSETLRAALTKVRLDYGTEFLSGGFNPRPMKLSGMYRLGTLSEHAIGNAVDIDAANNAQIGATGWAHVLKFTGKTLDQATRKSRWKSAPQELHTAIEEINAEFVRKLEEEIQKATKAIDAENEAAAKKEEDAKTAQAENAASGQVVTPAKKVAPPKKAMIKADPLTRAIAGNTELKSLGSSFIKQWQKGFFALPWELVKELHEEKFTWGAIFKDPDLHHFEL